MGLKPRLEALFHLPAETYNAVILPAMAEQRFGVAKGAHNFICIDLSNGLGASLCCNGMAVAGAADMAGELGHTMIDYGAPDQKLCYCGKPGCAESSASYPALVNKLEAELNRGVFSALSMHLKENRITVQAIRKALDENDRMCMHYVKDIATRIGLVIANAVNMLNPELIVLYGFSTSVRDLIRFIPEEKDILLPEAVRTEDGWYITYRVPYYFIRRFFPEFKAESGKTMRANFYKCGDLTVKEHYFAWNPIVGEEMSFHRTCDFRMLEFE